jgi:hypothetical protein
MRSKYPPAEPEALRLLAPQRGLFATVESKSKNNSKKAECKTRVYSMAQVRFRFPVTNRVSLLFLPKTARRPKDYAACPVI